MGVGVCGVGGVSVCGVGVSCGVWLGGVIRGYVGRGDKDGAFQAAAGRSPPLDPSYRHRPSRRAPGLRTWARQGGTNT